MRFIAAANGQRQRNKVLPKGMEQKSEKIYFTAREDAIGTVSMVCFLCYPCFCLLIHSQQDRIPASGQTKIALHNIHLRKRINKRNPLRQTNLSL